MRAIIRFEYEPPDTGGVCVLSPCTTAAPVMLMLPSCLIFPPPLPCLPMLPLPPPAPDPPTPTPHFPLPPRANFPLPPPPAAAQVSLAGLGEGDRGLSAEPRSPLGGAVVMSQRDLGG